jgi:hypothetical protein
MNVAEWGMTVVAAVDRIISEEGATAGGVKRCPFVSKPGGPGEPVPKRKAQSKIDCASFDAWTITVKEGIC